ncbi:MAG: phosphopyruvate hydratase [Clostridiales bacterium]|nr:phosphopyruvate hydratase [Clostridiales bacterium]
MGNTTIKEVRALQVLDSRGNPTVMAEVELCCGIVGRAMAPSGASTGAFEAHELRDKGKSYLGRGVTKAVSHLNTEIAARLKGMDARDQAALDAALIELDGTENKSRLGANAILAASLGAADGAAKAQKTPLYRYLGGNGATRLPIPMMNILNGGAHADNNMDIQEFMILPHGAEDYPTGLEWCCRIYHTLKDLLKARGLSTAVGDEGGFAPQLSSHIEAIELILAAMEKAGLRPGEDVALALDAAASGWYQNGRYRMPKCQEEFTPKELIAYWQTLCSRYPIRSIEDGLMEEDWEHWPRLTAALSPAVMLIGDDLFVTNEKRLSRGIHERAATGILVKPNQIGTLTETLTAIRTAQQGGFETVISHRSGETEDTFIADLSVAVNAGYIKAGAPCRTERVAKYNRLLWIGRDMAKEKSRY